MRSRKGQVSTDALLIISLVVSAFSVVFSTVAVIALVVSVAR